MSYQISSPKYSFIKFNDLDQDDDCCKDDQTFCLPIFAISDLRFQMKITGSDEAATDTIWALANDKIQLTLHKGTGDIAAAKNFTVDDGLYFTKIRISATEILYTWTKDLSGLFTHIDCKGCFRLGVKVDGYEGTNYSNCFVRICDDCFTSVFEYYNDDDFAGFKYCNTYGFANRVRLPFYFQDPQYPEDETVYIKSNGFRKVLRLNVIKEYSVITEHFPELMHDKMKVALSHDNTYVTGQKYTGSFRKSSPYTPEWTQGFCLAPAAFKVLVNPDISVNNNCQSCEDLPDGCAEISGLTTDSENGGSDWSAEISAASFAATPNPPVNQYVDIFYRQGGSTGAYTFAGNITFDSTGAIVSTPNPFVISGLDDSWGYIEIKAVNQCGGSAFFKSVYNPCQTLAGLTAVTTDGDTTWGVDITNVVYSTWPQFGVHKTLNIFYREYGSGSGWTAAGSIDVVVAAGFAVTITPNPKSIVGLDSDWEKVEIKVEYDCGRQLLQVFSNPLSGCSAVTVVTVQNVTDTDVDLNWPRVLPTPSGGYDWELWDYGMTGMITSGNVNDPGGTLFLYIPGLTPNTHYNFRLRTVCDVGVFSSWTNQDFTTLP